MATDRIEFHVLDVGQGACNFIEIYNTSDPAKPPVETMLIDCGSTHEQTAAGGPSVKYVIDRLQSMATPSIDTVLLTHSDDDHINLLAKVLDEFDPDGTPFPTKPLLRINKLCFGGEQKKYTKRKKNVLTRIKQYLKNAATDVLQCSPQGSGYDPVKGSWKEFRSTNDVTLFLVIGNVTEANVSLAAKATSHLKPGVGYAINTRSLVIVVEFASVRMVATGDATALAMAKCNELFEAYGHGVNNVFMATLPHHGSRLTALNLLNIEANVGDSISLAEQNLSDFAAHIGAETISASADITIHKHPAAELIDYFVTNMPVHGPAYYVEPRLGASLHFYTAYFWPKAYDVNTAVGGGVQMTEDWPNSKGPLPFTVQTTENVFTTLQFMVKRQNSTKNKWGVIMPPFTPGQRSAGLVEKDPLKIPPTPALGASWTFTVDHLGTKTVTPFANRLALLAAMNDAGGAPIARSALFDGQAAKPMSEVQRRPTRSAASGPALRGLKRLS